MLKKELIDIFAEACSRITLKTILLWIIVTGAVFYTPATIEHYPFLSIPLKAIQLFFFLSTLLFFTATFAQRGFAFTVNKVLFVIGCYFCFACLTIFLNGGDSKADGFAEWFYSLKNYIFLVCCFYILKKQDYTHIAYALLITALINCGLSYINFFFSIGDKSGLFTDIGKLGRLLVVIHGFLLIHICQRPISRFHIISLITLAIILCDIALLQSRGVYILYILTSGAIIFLTGNKKMIWGGILCIICILPVFGYMTWLRIQRNNMLIRNDSDLGRISTMYAATKMWQTHPVIGVGYGTSRFQFEKFANKKLVAPISVTAIHNIYLAQLAETGIIGFMLFLSFNSMTIVALIKRIRKRVHRSSPLLHECPWEIFYLISITIYLLHGFVYPTFESEGYYWFIMLGALLLIYKTPDTKFYGKKTIYDK